MQPRESIKNRKSTGRFASSAGFPPLQNVGRHELRTAGCEVRVDTITDTTPPWKSRAKPNRFPARWTRQRSNSGKCPRDRLSAHYGIATWVGVRRSMVDPSPSWPWKFSPQQ